MYKMKRGKTDKKDKKIHNIKQSLKRWGPSTTNQLSIRLGITRNNILVIMRQDSTFNKTQKGQEIIWSLV